jgi:hypothetical protein
LIGNHDLPLYRISRPPLFYHKDGHSKIQAAYDAWVGDGRVLDAVLERAFELRGSALSTTLWPSSAPYRCRLLGNACGVVTARVDRFIAEDGRGPCQDMILRVIGRQGASVLVRVMGLILCSLAVEIVLTALDVGGWTVPR